MFSMEWIRHNIANVSYFFTKHADQERQNDGLSITEVNEAIQNGRVIEQYQDAGRGESCLVAGFTNTGKPIHVVCGERREKLAIITVYIPTPPKFINPFERG